MCRPKRSASESIIAGKRLWNYPHHFKALDFHFGGQLYHIPATAAFFFESYVISELLKNYMNRGEEHAIYFWRDSTANEIDVIIDEGDSVIPLEIKAGQTVTSDFFREIRFWRKLSTDNEQWAALVYGGDETYIRSETYVYPWSVF